MSAIIDDIVRINLDTADRTIGHAKRGQHPKHHGCVNAVFSVMDNVPPDLKTGIFSKKQSFKALIRFSNGEKEDDREPDAHGMAIKLLLPALTPEEEAQISAPGETERFLNPEELGRVVASDQMNTQDFILVDSEVFFTGDLEEYRVFSDGYLRARGNWVRKIIFGIRTALSNKPLLERAQAFTKRKIEFPLETSYFSAVPYALGETPVKYIATPRRFADGRGKLSSSNGLAEALKEALGKDSFVFDFGVDVQIDPATQPVEDPTKKWSEQKGARREWLAVITIPQQKVIPTSRVAEDIVYAPWHALQEHRPLGAINEARKLVYQEMADLRRKLNSL